ncbi:RNA-binding S4 domain-containing protein [Aquabacterium sp.]|uniref:RNA-binding S4 domain-containing protein n=1 Tax=Aquabacterium sp. TaxID=1872578 RepID=UPI0035B3BCCC
MSSQQTLDFELRGEFIPLDSLLKAAGVADSGGAAKALVAAGEVQVDGQTELRKTCKIRGGQVVQLAGVTITVRSA